MMSLRWWLEAALVTGIRGQAAGLQLGSQENGPASEGRTKIEAQVSEAEETIREAVASVPATLARRLGAVQFDLRASEEEVASRWRWGETVWRRR